MKTQRVCLVIDRESRRMADALASQDGLSLSATVRLLIRREYAVRLDKRRRRA